MTSPLTNRVQALADRYPIDPALVIGLDIGVASVGSAVVRHADGPAILFLGSRTFDIPEEPKTRALKNKTRRDNRLMRRTIRRRAQRMRKLRQVFAEHGLLATTRPDPFHLHRDAPDPWQARAAGLDRRLSEAELAAALLHIAKHRGFKSNKKSDLGNNAKDDDKRMLGAVRTNQERLAQYGSIARMVLNDPRYQGRRRNRTGEYLYTFARSDLYTEAEQILEHQRRLGHPHASESLQTAFLDIAFHQATIPDSGDMVGDCPFEAARRTARHAPSFELFRLLAKLNTVKVHTSDGGTRRLTPDELATAADGFGTRTKSLTWKALAKKLGLPGPESFDGIDASLAQRDVAAASGCAKGTKTLYDVLGPAGWNAVRHDAETLDAIAETLTFREDLDRIAAGLDAIPDLDPHVRDALMDAASEGRFAEFRQAGHISAKAARNLIPELLKGKVYSDACAAVGYDHAAPRRVDLDDIRNPVVARCLRGAIKQVTTLVHHFQARPGRIVVELGREVGKSGEERDAITKGIERRTREKERRRAQMKDDFGLAHEPTEEDLRRYELWREQNYRCIYTDTPIAPRDVLESSNDVQVDHVLPRSRSQDNSYLNQVLSFTTANQEKGQRTPYEWLARDGASRRSSATSWERYEARVRQLRIKRAKKNRLVLRHFDERERGFVERNMNDTKYAARALLSGLRELYPDTGEPDPAAPGGAVRETRRLFARPGQITAILRRAWGLESLKAGRDDDRHHAIDALICAAASQSWLLESLTRQYQQLERANRSTWTPPVPAPWSGFRDDALAAYESVRVSRPEKQRARGQGHLETLYRFEDNPDGTRSVFERKAVKDLTRADLARLKDADGGNKPLAATLADWIERGKPADDPPHSSNGDAVRRVYLHRRAQSGMIVNDAFVEKTGMVRVDVFAMPDKKERDRFYMVPIYRHQVMAPNTWAEPPNKIVTRDKPYCAWDELTPEHRFLFSLYPDSYVEVVNKDGQLLEGYFRGANVNTNSITLSPHHDHVQTMGSIGIKTARAVRKFHIDRLGGKHRVRGETRTWHGAACI